MTAEDERLHNIARNTWLTMCAGKQQFESYSAAERAAKRLRGKDRIPTTPYRCRSCQTWHLGSGRGVRK